MKSISKIATFSLLLIAGFANAKGGAGGYSHSYGTGSKLESSHVSGYTTSSGTHVDSYNRSTSDNTKNNNWSTKGNINPDTGRPGTKQGN